MYKFTSTVNDRGRGDARPNHNILCRFLQPFVQKLVRNVAKMMQTTPGLSSVSFCRQLVYTTNATAVSNSVIRKQCRSQ